MWCVRHALTFTYDNVRSYSIMSHKPRVQKVKPLGAKIIRYKCPV